MSPAPHNSGEHPADLHGRVVALESWARSVERDIARGENTDRDFETRIRILEAAHMKLTGKLTLLAVVGSAGATGAVQLLIRVMG